MTQPCPDYEIDPKSNESPSGIDPTSNAGGSKELSFGERDSFKFSKDFKVGNGQLPIWNILPSYDLYSRSFLNSTTVEQDPPSYEGSLKTVDTRTSDGSSINTAIGMSRNASTSTNITATNSSQTQFVSAVNDINASTSQQDVTGSERITVNDSGCSWGDTVLDNIHKLNNLTDTDNAYSNAISIDIKFTKDICDINKESEVIDPSNFEYKQGDLINGYITIENSKHFDVEFKMFYVLFEGVLTHGTNNFKSKFLEMFEFSSSYHDGTINRLITEYDEPYMCPHLTDCGGYHLSWPSKILRAGRKYKRFFSFKIPNNLLDTQCHDQFDSHVKLLPTLGNVKKTAINQINYEVKDFANLGSSVDYHISATFIGKGSSYRFNANDRSRLFNNRGDEYLILKQNSEMIRIIPDPVDYYKESQQQYRSAAYKLFIKAIEEKLFLGRQLQKVLTGSTIDHSIDDLIDSFEEKLNTGQSNKACQLYTNTIQEKQSFNEFLQVETKPEPSHGLFKSKKNSLHPLQLTTPNITYEIPYIPPKSSRPTSYTLPDLTFSFPLNLNSELINIPRLKSVQVELSVLTVKSENTPIPIEFNHDMFIQNSNPSASILSDQDNFKFHIIKKFKDYFYQFKNISEDVDLQNLRIEKQMFDGIKCLATLQEKLINLDVHNPQLQHGSDNSPVDQPSWVKTANGYLSNFNLVIDLNNLSTKGSRINDPFDNFTLVPDFQTCHISRFYYFKVGLIFHNQTIMVKIPASVVSQ